LIALAQQRHLFALRRAIRQHRSRGLGGLAILRGSVGVGRETFDPLCEVITALGIALQRVLGLVPVAQCLAFGGLCG
jgi:hypothetical protein